MKKRKRRYWVIGHIKPKGKEAILRVDRNEWGMTVGTGGSGSDQLEAIEVAVAATIRTLRKEGNPGTVVFNRLCGAVQRGIDTAQIEENRVIGVRMEVIYDERNKN